MKHYPHRMHELRMAAGWSLDQLAQRVNSTRSTLHGVENGRTEMSLHWMRRLGDAFGISPAEILHAQDRPYVLSADELRLLDQVRALPADRRALLPGMLAALAAPAAA